MAQRTSEELLTNLEVQFSLLKGEKSLSKNRSYENLSGDQINQTFTFDLANM